VLPPLLCTQVDHLKSGLHFSPHIGWTMTGSRRFRSFARQDVPMAELHRLNSGHFAVEDCLEYIARHIRRFYAEQVR
jgi:hypothetical protein